MLTPEIMANNQTSWLDLLLDIDQDPDNDVWTEWKSFMRNLLQTGIDDGWSKYFRAGRAMNEIIFSTYEQHRLERNGPYVFVARANREYFVAYAHLTGYLPAVKPERMDIVTSANVLAVLHTYLVRLWMETRPTEEMPQLNTARSW